MDKADRDKSGYLFSAQAAETLDKIGFTSEGVDRFFRELSKKQSVNLSRFGARFFLRGGKVCVSMSE